MNEAGLVVSAMGLEQTEYPAPDARLIFSPTNGFSISLTLQPQWQM